MHLVLGREPGDIPEAVVANTGRISLLEAIKTGKALKKVNPYPKRTFPKLHPVPIKKPASSPVPYDVEVESVASELDSIYDETVSALDANVETTDIASVEVITPVESPVSVPGSQSGQPEVSAPEAESATSSASDDVPAQNEEDKQAKEEAVEQIGWPCDVCTFTNEANATECAVCVSSEHKEVGARSTEAPKAVQNAPEQPPACESFDSSIGSLLRLLPLPLAASPLVAPVLKSIQESFCSRYELGGE